MEMPLETRCQLCVNNVVDQQKGLSNILLSTYIFSTLANDAPNQSSRHANGSPQAQLLAPRVAVLLQLFKNHVAGLPAGIWCATNTHQALWRRIRLFIIALSIYLQRKYKIFNQQ